MKKTLSIFFVLAMVAASAGSYLCMAQTKTPSPEIIVMQSPNLHCNDTVAVYSPSLKAAEKNLPTIFVLHGWSGCWRDWGKHTDLQALCDKTGWRIICPDGFYDSWYIDNADKEKMQWRTFFWEECWPKLAEKYGLDSAKTFIAGLSMGGHGAMNIFLDHPERFRGAGSMSGVLDLRYSSGSKDQIAQKLGRKNIERCDDQSAVYRLENLLALGTNEVAKKLLIIGCGTEDRTFYGASKLFEARCQSLGLNYIAHYNRGMHRWDYWCYILPYYIGWFSESLTECQ